MAALGAAMREVIHASPSLDAILPLRERMAGIAYQLGLTDLPPDPEVEAGLLELRLVLRHAPPEDDDDDPLVFFDDPD
jgi:hypothetical protein